MAADGATVQATRRQTSASASSRLPPNQQEVVRLKFQNGFSYQEISRITSLSVGNVGFIFTSLRMP